MASRAVPAPLALLPNALTILRLALIPLFIVVYVSADDGSSWAAGWIFLVAGVTDQVDGFLARRWHVESQFGKLADPLADRLMIDSAAILLCARGQAALGGAVIILLRDALLVGGYRLLMPRGYELNVTHARQGRHLAALPVGGDPARRRSRRPSGRSGSSGSRSALALAAAAQYVSRRGARWRR